MSHTYSAGPYPWPLMGSALALVLAVADVQALGLGGLRIQSALNQPFVGEIVLLDVKPDELDTVKVQIASADEFKRAGSERYHYLSGLRFSPQISPRGETVIRVSSREPIREPYMDLLLEVNWPKGRLVKGYTVLLDPPVTDGRRTSRIEAPAVQPRVPSDRPQTSQGSAPTGPAPSQRQVVAPPPAAQAAPVPTALAASAGGFPKYIGPVPRGAGLWRLASRNTPAGATVAQTAMALYRNNQDAFVRGDINRLRVGKTLVIPHAAELFALGPEAADREFAAALRGETVRRAPIAEPKRTAPESEPLLKIAGTAPEVPQPGAVLAPPPEGPEAVERELLLVREASESTRQETAELRDRIRELEAQLGEIQQLLQLRNAELARIQAAPALAEAAKAGQIPAPAEVPDRAATPAQPPPIGEEGPVSGLAPETPEAEVPKDHAQAGPGEVEVLQGPTEIVEIPLPAAGTEPTAQRPDSSAPVASGVPEGRVGAQAEAPAAKAALPAAEVSGPAPGAEPPVAGPEPAPAAQPKPAPSAPKLTEQIALALPPPWGDLLVPLAGAAGVAVLGVGALAWARARRRRASRESELESGSLELSPGPAGSLAQGQGSADAARGREDSSGLGAAAAATAPSVFSALGHSQAESDEADVLSEADIYIAYGRFREAEELLREEIQRTPERIELKYKLAESYHGAKNYPALDELMREMQGSGEDRLHPQRWQRLVDMAKAIEGLERTDAGVRPATPRAAAGTLGLVDRGGPRSGDAFSLDISDAKGSFSGLGLAGEPGEVLGSSSDPSQRDVPVLRSTRPVPQARGGLDPLSLDLDVLPGSLELGARPDPAARPSDLEPEEGDLFGAMSDLELTIDDLRTASDVDLESFVDSTRTVSTLEDEPPAPPEMAGAQGGHPPRLQEVTSDGGWVAEDRGLAASQFGLEEDGSSDLLSSQWQMDSGLWDETATKLDLARAYVEMGDQDSAKGILEEVANEGNEEQRNEATQMLRALG